MNIDCPRGESSRKNLDSEEREITHSSCILLLSGGIDSTSLIPILRGHRLRIYPLFCDYGQTNCEQEKNAAQYVAEATCIEPLRKVSLNLWNSISHPLLAAEGKSAQNSSFFLPYRNLSLATVAAIYAKEIGATSIAFGFNADGLLPDTGSQFVDAINRALSFDSDDSKKVTVWNGAIALTKAELVAAGINARLPLEITHSCYYTERCGQCPACVAVTKAFRSLEQTFDAETLQLRNPNMRVSTIARLSGLLLRDTFTSIVG